MAMGIIHDSGGERSFWRELPLRSRHRKGYVPTDPLCGHDRNGYLVTPNHRGALPQAPKLNPQAPKLNPQALNLKPHG